MGQKSYKIAFIEESRCIGCMQCLAVCPVDAIVGASNFIHTVMSKVCIGCELCVPACPVDCIILKSEPNALLLKNREIKVRIIARKTRLKEKQSQLRDPPALKQTIVDSLARIKAKKQSPV